MYPGTIHTGGIVYGTIVATAFSATIFTAWSHLMPDNYAVSLGEAEVFEGELR